MNANNGATMTPVMIVTRPSAQGTGFAQAVVSQWSGPIRVLQSPLIAIKSVPVSADLSQVTDLIFTSANGVVAAKDLPIPLGLRAWCVGQKTAACAQEAGFKSIVGPGDADRLAEQIISGIHTGQFAHIRGQHSRGAISQRLKGAGTSCTDVIAYDQMACELNAAAKLAVKGKDPVLFPLFSPRTSTILSKQGPFAAETHLVTMSDAVREEVMFAAATTTIATHPTEAAMVTATLQSLCGLTQRRG